MCRSPYDAVAGRSFIEQAFELFQEQGDVTGTLLSWYAAVWSVMYEWRLRPLGRLVDWIEKYLTANPVFPSPEIEGAVATAMAMALTYGRPSHPDHRSWVEKSLELIPTCGQQLDQHPGLHYSDGVLLLAGRI